MRAKAKETEGAAAEIPDPPAHLSERCCTLWRQLAGAEAQSVERQALLRAALEALDRADEARRIIEAEGLVLRTKSTGAAHVNPAVKVEHEARNQFLKAWTLLGLTQKSEWTWG